MKIDLSKEIKKITDTYSQEVTDGLKKSVKNIAKTSVRNLKLTSPNRTGDYAKSWGSVIKETSTNISVTVRNKNEYQLTHILEDGHQNRDGSFTDGDIHIYPVEQKAIKDLEKEIKKVIGG